MAARSLLLLCALCGLFLKAQAFHILPTTARTFNTALRSTMDNPNKVRPRRPDVDVQFLPLSDLPPRSSFLLTLPVAPPSSHERLQGGKGIGRLELDEAAISAKCQYDMVLVERLQPPVETDTGLYKGAEEQPKLHVARVLSVGAGREEENGVLAAMPDVGVGDTVVVKNPWGIGPKDEEVREGGLAARATRKRQRRRVAVRVASTSTNPLDSLSLFLADR